MRGGRLRWVLVLAALVLVAGCDGGDGFTLVVELKTDLVPAAEFDGVTVEVQGIGSDEIFPRAGEDFVAGQRVGEFTGLAEGTYRATVSLFSDGRAIVERPVVVSLRAAQVATVVVTRACRDVSCPDAASPEATACLDGRCVVPECTPETPDLCPAAGCAGDGDCDPAAACAVARCREGVCFEEDDGTCGTDAYCEVGAAMCVARPGVDAGPPGVDAGPPLGPVALRDTGVDLSGLVAHWDFDAVVASDGSALPAAPDPTIVAVLESGDATSSVVPGKVGDAIQLDGVDDRLVAPDAPALDIAGAHTLTAWVYMDEVPTVDFGVVGKQDAYTLEIESDTGCIDFAVFQAAGGFDELDPSGCALTAGEWHHLAAVFDGAELIVYQDGVEVDRLAWTGASVILNDLPLLIGFNATDPIRYFAGRLDEVTVWARALSAGEVATIERLQRPAPGGGSG